MPNTTAEWGANIELRSRFLEMKSSLDAGQIEAFFKVFAGKSVDQFDITQSHRNPFPVMFMSAADMAVMSASWSVDQRWQELHQKVCAVVGQQAPYTFLDEIVEIYQKDEVLKDDALSKVGWLAPEFCHGVPITVDLDADDETLKLAFEVWLAGVRSEENARFKRSVTADDFKKWHKFRVLAAFDLYQWAEIYGVRLTNTQIANALFPPDAVSEEDRDIDMGERLRKVVKPLVEQTITSSTVRLITASARLERYLDQVVSRDKEKRAKLEAEREAGIRVPDGEL
ncbi:hypothetical protein ABIE20_001213 [Pseudomonas sp. 2835]